MKEFNNILAEKEGLQDTVGALQLQYRNSEEDHEVSSNTGKICFSLTKYSGQV